MSGSEFDPDQLQDRHHVRPKQEFHQPRHQFSLHREHQAETQQSPKGAGDHMQIDSKFHREEPKRQHQVHGQVDPNRHMKVSEDQARRKDRHSRGAEDQTAVAPTFDCKSIRLEAFLNEPARLTQEANFVTGKTMEELSSARDLATIRSSHRNISGSLDRVFCRVCNKKFPSGRALGGHMRVHGPILTQGSAGRLHGVFHLAASGSQKLEEERAAHDDEDHDPTSAVDAFEGKSDEDLAQDRYVGSEPANYSLSSCGGGEDNPRISCKDGFGDAGDRSLCGEETGLLSLECNTDVAEDGEVAMMSANSTVKKNFMYKLRHNPKRTCRFADHEFTLEAQDALTDFPGMTSSISSAGLAVCSLCGKAFWSERALYGHMRCHPEREWRGVLPPDSCSLEQRAMISNRRKRKLAALNNLEKSKVKIKSDVVKGEDTIEELDATAKTGSAENCLHITKEAASIKVKDMPEVDEKGEEALQNKVSSMHLLQECLSFTSTSGKKDVTPRRWLTNGRRSRRTRAVSKTAVAVETSSADDAALTSESISLDLGMEQEQELETPDFLILLAEAAKKIEEAGTNLQDQHLQLINSAAKCGYGFSAADLRRGFQFAQLDKALDAGGDEDDTGGDDDDDDDEDAPRSARRERLHKDLVANACVDGGKYECSTCKKTFHSHQALGGHRASHQKTKGCFARTGFSSEPLLVEELQLACGQEREAVHSIHKRKKQKQGIPQFRGHACSICHRIFLTGQALGGHKRCHWAGDQKPAETASVASTEKQPSLQSEEQSSKVVEGGIDLNMPAPMDEADDETGYGSGEQHLTGGECTQAEAKDVGTCRRMMRGGSSDAEKGISALAWSVNDLLTGDATSSITHIGGATTEIEARNSSLDGIWGQHWANKKKKGAPYTLQIIPQQACAMQSLV